MFLRGAAREQSHLMSREWGRGSREGEQLGGVMTPLSIYVLPTP